MDKNQVDTITHPTPQEQYQRLTPENRRIVDSEIERLLDMMKNPAAVERIIHYCEANGLPLPPVEVLPHD